MRQGAAIFSDSAGRCKRQKYDIRLAGIVMKSIAAGMTAGKKKYFDNRIIAEKTLNYNPEYDYFGKEFSEKGK